ncbi:MAG: F0F1 ATP synthase subunit B [Saprospiraceae bacterium]
MDFLFLADFSVVKPGIGLLFWTSIIFLFVWFFLGRMAFGPIQKALKDRENTIQDSLDEAKQAREEMSKLKAENESILAQAREERATILKEAKDAKDSMINEAKVKAKEEAQKIVASAKVEIENQKNAAMMEVKNKAGMMALGIAEKIIKKQLIGDGEQEKFANSLVDEIKLN